MKIYKFDPATGKRGEHIDTRELLEWTDARARIDCVLPNTPGEKWSVHQGAGATGPDHKDLSYQTDEWICFCWGPLVRGEEFVAGEEIWEWIVLPPKVAGES